MLWCFLQIYVSETDAFVSNVFIRYSWFYRKKNYLWAKELHIYDGLCITYSLIRHICVILYSFVYQ